MLLWLLACLDNDQAPGSEDAFVAMQADFAGYPTWASTVADGTVDGHDGDSRTVYISEEPEAGSTAFPVGTILVKVSATETHAMVKRGGGFNPTGAVGWEWFELKAASDGTPVIAWRGAEAPSGAGYGDLGASDTAAPPGDCNGCHYSAFENDYVHTVPL